MPAKYEYDLADSYSLGLMDEFIAGKAVDGWRIHTFNVFLEGERSSILHYVVLMERPAPVVPSKPPEFPSSPPKA